jgi:biopolymer transport protein ExbD
MKKVNADLDPISGVNIIPVIDVTLVLLVIFIVLSPIMNLPNIPVQLPEAMTKETKDQNLTVSLGSDGTISIDTDVITWDALPGALRQKLSERKNDVVVIVRADKNLPYGNVENFLRTVNKYAGKHAVAIATQQRSKPLAEKS